MSSPSRPIATCSEQFGYAQVEAYRQDMLDCLAMIADHPEMGRRADAVGAGVRRREHDSHVVFYERCRASSRSSRSSTHAASGA